MPAPCLPPGAKTRHRVPGFQAPAGSQFQPTIMPGMLSKRARSDDCEAPAPKSRKFEDEIPEATETQPQGDEYVVKWLRNAHRILRQWKKDHPSKKADLSEFYRLVSLATTTPEQKVQLQEMFGIGEP